MYKASEYKTAQNLKGLSRTIKIFQCIQNGFSFIRNSSLRKNFHLRRHFNSTHKNDLRYGKTGIDRVMDCYKISPFYEHIRSFVDCSETISQADIQHRTILRQAQA